MNNYLYMQLPIPYWKEDIPDKTEEKQEERVIVIDLYAEEATDRDREV